MPFPLVYGRDFWPQSRSEHEHRNKSRPPAALPLGGKLVRGSTKAARQDAQTGPPALPGEPWCRRQNTSLLETTEKPNPGEMEIRSISTLKNFSF